MDFDYLFKELPRGGENINKASIKKKIYGYLPVPTDFEILYAEVNSYHGTASGVVLTNKGIIIKSPKLKKDKHGRKNSIYQYIPWEYYDPENYKIVKADKSYTILAGEETLTEFFNEDLYNFFKDTEKRYIKDSICNSMIAQEIIVGDLETVAFHATYGHDNTITGHGIYAEEAGAKLDKLMGEDVSVVGRDNAKNGPDKIVDKIPVQCKYYKSAEGSVRACFKKDPLTGDNIFRYYQLDGKTPMMVEVPKDQYDKAVQLLQDRIKKGEIPGIDNPEVAKNIIRKGKLTYKQTVNLAKAGTVESLTYDIATGIVSCSAIGGISAVTVFSVTYWQTKDIKKATRASLSAGLEVFGPAFAGRVIASQMARTSISNVLIPMTTSITKFLSPKTVQSIVNSFRNMAGKKSIYGAAAQKSFAKALRTNVLTQIIIFGVTSIPDTYKLIMGRVTVAQYTKNLTSGAAALAGGAAGAVAGAKIGVKFAPGYTKIAGVAGGAIGGFISGAVVRGIGSMIKEDDGKIYARMLNATICAMAIDYLLSEEEVDSLINKLNEDEKKLKKLLENITSSKTQYHDIESFMEPYFEEIVMKRKIIGVDEEKLMIEEMDSAIIELSKEEFENEL